MRKVLLGILLLCSGFIGYAAGPDLTVTGINPLPAQIVSGTTLTGLTYNIHNNNTTNTFNISFSGLNTDGLSFATTCGSLAPGANCTLILALVVETLKPGVPYLFWQHPYYVLGALNPVRLPQILESTIIPGASTIAPTTNITLSDGATSPTPSTFTVTLTDAQGNPHVYSSVAFGQSTLSPSLAAAVYTVTVSPSTVTDAGNTYDAPVAFPYNLASAGNVANIIYALDQSVSVQTNYTAPNIGSATSATTCTGAAGTYGPQNQGAGSVNFMSMKPGSYTCTAASYTGTDAKIYSATMSNPYTISSGSHVIAATFAAPAPSTYAVTTALTLPGTSAGFTVPITLSDTANTYGPFNQAAGSSPFAPAVVGATDYTLTCPSYTVGSDTYSATPANPVTIGPGSTVLTCVYSKVAPPGANYNWHASHISPLVAANFFAVWIGGGSTTAPVQISSNPPINAWLNAQIATYQTSPTAILPAAYVKEFPHYLAIGTILEAPSTSVVSQLSALKINSGFHYEGNGSGDRGCFWDDSSCGNHYTPQVDAIAAQEKQVFTNSGNQMINGTAFYTIDYSDGFTAILLDTENDTNVTAHQYNLMYEAQRMQYQYSQGNPMVLLLNPDSTEIFQNCSLYNCPTAWKPNIYQAGSGHVIAIPNLQADTDVAIDRMVTQGYLTSGQATTMKADLVSSGILTPPVASGRTVPGIPELVLTNSWMIKYLGPNIAFGLGNNEYNSNNGLLAPTGTPPVCSTASFEWIHCIAHQGFTSDQLAAAINYQAQKWVNFANDMNFNGDAHGNYKPDFLYWDRYERDVIPGYVPSGFMLNGPDWDNYLTYLSDIQSLLGHPPMALWQMPGATMQITGFNDPSLIQRMARTVGVSKKPELTTAQMQRWATLYAPPKKAKHKVKHSRLGNTVSASIMLTAPNLGSTVSITMQDADPTLSPPPVPAHSYTHSVPAGTSVFDDMFYAQGEWEHQYWLIGAQYTGAGHTYWAECVNPYGISNNVSSFAVTYGYPVALTSTSAAPKVGSNTPSVTIQSCYSYTNNLTPGTTQAWSSAIVPGVYNDTGATYFNGTEAFFFIPQASFTVTQAGTNNFFAAWGTWGDTFGDWFFGHPTLNNDLSNLSADFSMNYIPFTPTMNNTIYYTTKSNVANAEDYLKLTSASP